MQSIRLQSSFKYMLAGLVVLLLLSSVEALPTHKKPGSCLIRTPQSKSQHKRSPVIHPSAKNAVILFHGTSKAGAATSMAHHVDLLKTHSCGDLHHNKKHGSDGGAYFTDSVVAAAQYACFEHAYDEKNVALPTTVDVLEFGWTPGNYKVYEFKAGEILSAAQCGAHDMVTGPMTNVDTDKFFTPTFWQYALVKQAATAGLAYRHTYKIHCKHLRRGALLSDVDYTHGQGGNPGFQALVTKFTSASSC